jgi:hypothetical protein
LLRLLSLEDRCPASGFVVSSRFLKPEECDTILFIFNRLLRFYIRLTVKSWIQTVKTLGRRSDWGSYFRA